MLYIIGAAFLIIYLICGGPKYYKNIAFLFPAFILPAVEFANYPAMQFTNYLGMYTSSYNLNSVIILAMLGVSFLLIFVVHSVWQKDISRSKRDWPLVVSILLFIASLANLIDRFRQWEYTRLLIRNFWPIVLIIIGVYILFNTFTKKNKEN
ncbi:MAG: hypothetical protein Q8936_00045 [Bacillota bacterium]|nr:hypothetical protein [Bacillota bacterium]